MHSFKIQTEVSLLNFLLSQFPSAPRTRVKKWLQLGCVSVNAKSVTKHNHALAKGDEVRVEPGKKTPLLFDSPMKVVFQDTDILVVDKPAGLLTVSTEKEKIKTAYFQLNEWLKQANPPERVFIVHRLDRETSGLLVFAKNEAAKKKLQDDWDGAEKHYTAVVEGKPPKDEDTLESMLSENKALRVFSADHGIKSAKLAVTHYQLIKTSGFFSLLDVVPQTGRKNQIRVQLSEIGTPVTGDKKYGAAKNPIGRLALHARELSFEHPVTRQFMTFKSEVPREIPKILR